LYRYTAGGAVSRTATAPLETVRLRMMTGVGMGCCGAGADASAVAAAGAALQQKMSGGILARVGSIARLEGWRALFKGNLANVMRFAPTKGLDFFTFHAYKVGLCRLNQVDT
jgi:solute carrier family 25 phosphate transporter 23/24/25/41